MRKRILAILIMVGFGSTLCLAQRGFELGAHLGSSVYFGDLNTNFDLSSPGINFGVLARRNFNERLSLAIGLDYGHISADDINSNNFYEKSRNLSFKSNVFDLNFSLEFNFFPYIHGSDDHFYTPYLIAGFSVVKYNPQAELNGTTYSLRDFGTEGQLQSQEYGLMTGAFMFGFGLKWDINRDYSINTSLSGRNLFSDYIDDVSGNYPNFSSLQAKHGITAVELSNRAINPDFAVEGQQRGNGKNNDLVYFISVGIMKYFGELPCPAISKNNF